ncbi:MAG: dienelactone hydrolase family protein [Candidatus Rokubacteria bacterium]|nr:dienelactone hydrolase family protein [Candidatus Rokubacteria bacterium]MBI3826364.1 dienelactone hydrolase family protein [Candidatus Rokubacteria bacterium]
MGEKLTLTAEDGHKFSAYRATPAGAPRGALVVIQEIFGVNHHIRNVTDGFARDGYVAIAPALFDRVEPDYETGYEQADVERGRNVRQKLGWDSMIMDVRAAVKEAAKTGLKVGVVGYCMGGTLAWLAGTRIDGVSAAVGYYGGGIADTASERPKCPVMLHFGETDASIPPEHWKTVRAAQPTLPVFVYAGAGHGFSCDERASFHRPSHEQARERTTEFFQKHVG